MKTTKKIMSLILVAIMVFSTFSVGISVNAVETGSGTVFTPIPTTPAERPDVQFYCTEVTRVAKAVNSVEPGTTIVKATPSGVPELSGAYASQAYAGETPAATKITFVSNTVGVTPVSLTCSNETVKFSEMTYDGSTGTYSCEIVSGTATKNTDGTFEPLTFTMDYRWTDGNEYQEKCVSYVEGIVTGGVFTYIECTFMPFSGTASYYRTSVSAITRLLGRGVYYEQPATITTSDNDPYKTYGIYNCSTATYSSNVASGYNTLIYKDDKNVEAKGGTKDIYFDNFIPGAPTAHVYIDSSTATTLADINLRFDANTQMLTDRNNKNPYTAVSNIYVYEGLQTGGLAGASNTTAESTIGYVVPAKANYGVTQQKENASMNTITGGARAYSKIFTKGFTGTVANIADSSQYTVTHEYYSYNYVNHSLDEGNLTTIAKVPTPIVFHVVDKGALRDLLEHVMTNDPDSPVIRNAKKGTNPQAWYYKSGFSNFQEAYVKALNVANNTRAMQTEIDAATKSLQSAYNSLTLKTADYTEADELKAKAEEIVDNAYAYPAEDVALVEEALTYYKNNYNILYQNAVDVMADNLRLAIRNATPYPADYQEVYAAKIAFEALNEEDYTKASWQNVLDVIAGVDFGLSILEQDTVDGYAQAILDATAALEIQTAEFDALIATADEAKALNENNYINFEILDEPLRIAEEAIEDDIINIWPKERQSEVDELNTSLRNAINSLILKDIDKTALREALDAPLRRNQTYYNQDLLTSYKALLNEGQTVYEDETLSTILEQPVVDAKTAEITAAYEALQASYNPPVDITPLEKALEKAAEVIEEHYYSDDALVEFLAAEFDGEQILFSTLTADSAQTVTDAADRILNAINALNIKPADTTELEKLRSDLVFIKDYEEVLVVTYTEGELGEEYVEKYDNRSIRSIVNSINTLLTEELTIKDNERVNAFVAETQERINSLTAYKTTEYLDVATEEYENNISKNYPEADKVLYTEAYNAAISLSDDATQEEINTALTDLVNAIPEEVVLVDKTDLEEILAEAKALDFRKYYNNEKMAELLDAIAEGEEILDTLLEDTEESRVLVDNSIIRIMEAIDNLDLVDDTSVLLEVVMRASEMLKETVEVVTYIDGELGTSEMPKYDADAIQAIIDDVTDVIISIERGDATVDVVGHVNEYAEEQQTKLDALSELTYTQYLETATDEYESITDSSIYTETTWADYEAAYVVATDLTDADQTQLNVALTNLVNAKNALELDDTPTTKFEAADGSTTVVDKENGIIYGLSDEGLTDIEDYVVYEGGVVEYEYLGEYFGTGTVVNFVVDGEVYESYTVIIFGDLNGDGVVDSYDYSVLAAIVNGDIEAEEGSALYLAADLFVDGAVDAYDLSVISSYVNGDAEISQNPDIVL